MENIPTKHKIEIQPKGSYFQIDENGFLINPASAEKIQEKWKPIIDDIVDVYKNTYGEKLRNVYIRGSVAKGEAIDNVSDIDTFAYVNMSKEELKDNNTNRDMRKHIEEKYDFVNGIEMNATPLSTAQNDYIILNQSVCVYGEPISVPNMKPGKEMASHAPGFHNRLSKFERFFHEESDPEEIQDFCTWAMKGFLRVGFELTMERSQKYTRDLYRCYETFVEYYPEKEPEMRQVLDLALNPTADKNKIKKIMDNLGVWLIAEIPKYFEVKK
jgi:hypothetical protein